MKLTNPFQKKYLPVLICVALAVLCILTHGFLGAFAFAAMACLNWGQADKPLSVFYTHAYSACAAVCLAIGVLAIFTHTWPLVIVGLVTSTLPLSIVFTRKGPA